MLVLLFPFRASRSFTSVSDHLLYPIGTFNSLTSFAWNENVIITLPSKVSVSDSVPIEVKYQYTTDAPLEFQIIAIKLEGPNFTIVPTSIISQTVRNKKETTFTWIISPNKTGEQTVLFNFSGMSEQLLDNMKGLNNKGVTTFTQPLPYSNPFHSIDFAENIPFTYKIIVVDTLGIPTKPATILGYIASFLGATLTLRWWYSVWEKFQERKAKMQTQSSQGGVRKHDK